MLTRWKYNYICKINIDFVFSGIGDGTPFESATLVGHSLSWKNDKLTLPRPGNKLHAKIWRPEDPCTAPDNKVDNNNCDKTIEKENIEHEQDNKSIDERRKKTFQC